ncbi:hypothetical protein JKP88DRAFT_268725 [Tribonema minus]|uniref:Uncharacterized protein n=1 Tax=Tribonema minus TaxID=303371 RepID=A0A835Z1T2_9STRA|nr:hypothetical protein JKP88DRAFT_268725 [Tribonema minus]
MLCGDDIDGGITDEQLAELEGVLCTEQRQEPTFTPAGVANMLTPAAVQSRCLHHGAAANISTSRARQHAHNSPAKPDTLETYNKSREEHLFTSASAVLVVATLVATLGISGWSVFPSGDSSTASGIPMMVYYVSASLSFYMSVATIAVCIIAMYMHSDDNHRPAQPKPYLVTIFGLLALAVGGGFVAFAALGWHTTESELSDSAQIGWAVVIFVLGILVVASAAGYAFFGLSKSDSSTIAAHDIKVDALRAKACALRAESLIALAQAANHDAKKQGRPLLFPSAGSDLKDLAQVAQIAACKATVAAHCAHLLRSKRGGPSVELQSFAYSHTSIAEGAYYQLVQQCTRDIDASYESTASFQEQVEATELLNSTTSAADWVRRTAKLLCPPAPAVNP